MTIGVDQLAALLQECPNFAPIHPKTCAAAAKWLLPRLEAGPPPDRGIVGALTDLQEMGRRIATPAVPRPHEPRPQAWLPDTFIERAYQSAAREAIGDGMVMLTAFEAVAIRQHARAGSPREAPR